MALGGNGKHRDRRKHGEDRHQQEDGALRERIADRARSQSDGDIAGMVEGRVPPHPPGQLFSRIEAQGQGRDRGTEHVADDRHQAVGDRHWPEARPGENDDRADRQHGKRQHDAPRLAWVSSIAAPIGVCTASPSRPPIVVTRPTSDWLQCCCVTRKTLR